MRTVDVDNTEVIRYRSIQRGDIMTERLFGPRPEVRIVDEEITEEWMREFNEDFAARIGSDEVGQHVPIPSHIASLTVEEWLEQPRSYEASSYFRLTDELGPDGWWQQLRGKVYHAREVYIPREVGGGKEPVVALYDASIVLADGTERPIADGLAVLVRLKRIKDSEIEIVPIAGDVA